MRYDVLCLVSRPPGILINPHYDDLTRDIKTPWRIFDANWLEYEGVLTTTIAQYDPTKVRFEEEGCI